jgi:hypothetical protein
MFKGQMLWVKLEISRVLRSCVDVAQNSEPHFWGISLWALTADPLKINRDRVESSSFFARDIENNSKFWNFNRNFQKNN